MKKPLLAFFIVLSLSLSGCVIYLLAKRDRARQQEHTRDAGSSNHAGDNRTRSTDASASSGSRTSRTRPASNLSGPSIDLQEARRLLNEFKKKDSDLINQAEFAAELIIKLCQSGNTSDAWEFIEPVRGQMRYMQLHEFFIHADLDRDELIARLSQPEFDAGVQRGLQGYLLRYKASDFLKEMNSPDITPLTAKLNRSPEELVYWAMESVRTDYYGRRELEKNIPEESIVRDFLDTVSTLRSEGKLDRNHFQQILVMSHIDDFERWDIARKHLGNPGDRTDPMIDHMIGKMMMADPPRGMNAVLAEPSSATTGAVASALRSW
ncbi:MAG: hypothetical protein EOP85_19700, partial [Verrucomicrobiaceae bacterium]